MKRWYLALLVIVPLLIFLVVTGSNPDHNNFKTAKKVTLLRKVAHHLLLSLGDKSSLVLPVREISENEFLLTFEKPFYLIPDSIAGVFQKMYPPSPGDYAVEVREQGKREILYSFVISADSNRTYIPCLERQFPRAHYSITVKLDHNRVPTSYYIAGMLLIGGTGIWLYKRKTKPAPSPVKTNGTIIPLGRYQFHIEQQQLECNGHLIDLTGKETHLLKIFALTPNTVVERNRLLKEVWEDEGVIVTRSLDMFISRLRKKLEYDPSAKLVNVHGKGYRLDIPAVTA